MGHRLASNQPNARGRRSLLRRLDYPALIGLILIFAFVYWVFDLYARTIA